MVKEAKIKESKTVNIKTIELMKVAYDIVNFVKCGKSPELAKSIYKLLTLVDENCKWLFNGKDLVKLFKTILENENESDNDIERYVNDALKIRNDIESII